MKHTPRRLSPALAGFRSFTSIAAVSLVGLTAPHGAQAQTTILKNNTSGAVQLDLTNAWVGGVVPGTNDLAAFGTNNSATSGALNIGDGVAFLGILATAAPSTANITITNNSTNTNSVMVLGASGVDWSAVSQVSGTNRELRLNPLLVLTNDQTWTTGLGLANAAMITASNTITGPGALTIAGTGGATNSFVFLSGSNSTFNGGLVLQPGGAVRFGSSSNQFSGGAVTASSYGTGPITINGGTIFGNQGVVGAAAININGDFAINSGSTTNSVNGRLTIGGTINLGGATRTVSLGKWGAPTNVLPGGQESLRILLQTNAAGGGPAVLFTNGTLRLVRDSLGGSGDYAVFTLTQSNTFSAGSGLTIGTNVITTLSTGNPFGSVASNQPHLTVEAGGYFNLADGANPRSPVVRTLAGNGVVTTLATNTNGTATITINAQAGDLATFSGTIANGASYTNLLGNTNLQARVALTKTGAGTQVLDGTNTYTGNTAVSAGRLELGTNGVLTFVIAPGTNNAVTGGGTAFFQGKFQFDLSTATTNDGDSWTIVSTTTRSYDGNFQVVGFTNSGGTWTRGANGVFYQFAQSNSILSVTTNPPTPSDPYSSWLANYPSLTGTNTNSAADPDIDGFINQAEFAFGGNPTVGTPALLTASKAGTNSVFTFIGDTNALSYSIQSTTNLTVGPWTNTTVTISVSPDQSGVLLTNYTRLQFTVPASGSTFYRAKGAPTP